MDGGDDQTPAGRNIVSDGEWAGWAISSSDPFEQYAGPFYSRRDPATGEVVCAFRAEPKHMNGGGFMHGGVYLTFADYALWPIAGEALAGGGSVTASLGGEFLDGAEAGELIEARGEVTRAGRSLVFVRGMITTSGRALFTFSGIIKKVRPRAS